MRESKIAGLNIHGFGSSMDQWTQLKNAHCSRRLNLGARLGFRKNKNATPLSLERQQRSSSNNACSSSTGKALHFFFFFSNGSYAYIAAAHFYNNRSNGYSSSGTVGDPRIFPTLEFVNFFLVNFKILVFFKNFFNYKINEYDFFIFKLTTYFRQKRK